ncbi:unnamed protein product, partial [Meganyctiphanes norvegica]
MIELNLLIFNFLGDSTDGTDGNSEFRCVFSNNLDDIKLIYAAKVDGADPELYEEDFHDMGSFVTVKSSKDLSSERMQYSFNRFGHAKQKSNIPYVVNRFVDEHFCLRPLN